MPPPKKDNTKLIIVVVIAVVLVIVVMIPVMLYLMVAGLGPGPGPGANNQPPIAVLQGAGSWSSNATVTTYTFTVSTVTPTTAHINPVQLQYLVSNAANTPLYSGAANQNTSSSGFVINVVFQDALNAGQVSAGDRVQITVTPVASNPLVGGNLQVNFNGDSLATGRM